MVLFPEIPKQDFRLSSQACQRTATPVFARRFFFILWQATSSGHSFFPLQQFESKTPSVYASIESSNLQTKSHKNHHNFQDGIQSSFEHLII
jgi:hypothetical protein